MSKIDDEAIKAKPVPKNLSIFARVVRKLFGGKRACNHCGRFYRKCYSNQVGLFTPIGGEGMFCPDGHEGYVDYLNIGGWYDQTRYDFVEKS